MQANKSQNRNYTISKAKDGTVFINVAEFKINLNNGAINQIINKTV